MGEIDIILDEDFDSITWDKLKEELQDTNTKINYKSENHKHRMACKENGFLAFFLFLIFIISYTLPVIEYFITDAVGILALIVLDALYLVFREKLNPIIRLCWWVFLMVSWVDVYHYIFACISINLFTTMGLLWIWNRFVENSCKKRLIKSEITFVDSWMKYIKDITVDKVRIGKIATETKEYSHHIDEKRLQRVCENIEEYIELNEKLEYYDNEFVKRFGHHTNPITGENISGAQDYLEALDAQEGNTVVKHKKMTVYELNQEFSRRFSYSGCPINGMEDYLRVFDEQQNQAKKQESYDKVPEKTTKPEIKDKDYYFSELNALIGMDSIKHDVEELINFVQMQNYRKEHGLKELPLSLHLVFSGNPGTGKTSVARILGDLYREIGVLKKGQLVETDRAGLVAGYVGQTAIKTKEKIDEAMDGILFIDEAYTLNKEGNDFGQEAIDTILKAMEDYRDRFVVIVAGYPDLMEKFINSNPGLKSRFNKVFHFPDYSAEELFEIFTKFCDDYDYIVAESAEYAIKEKIKDMVQNKGSNFANARDIRNMFEKIISNQASRVMNSQDLPNSEMMTITSEDI